MSDTNPIKSYFSEALQILLSFMEDENNLLKIEAAATIMADCFKAGGKILSCGNGGSLCDAMHFAEEMSGRFRGDRKALPALAISDPSYLTCAANDYGYAKIFSRYVEAFGKPGDVLLALSTSGNSPNILEAVNSAKEAGMKIVALTGKDGGKLGAMADIEIRAPWSGYADHIQEIHIKVIHALILRVEQKMFGDN